MRSVFLLTTCLLTPAAAGGCGTPGQDLDVRVAAPPAVAESVQVGAEVGRLLSPDPDASRAAEKRLVALTGDDLQAFLAYAQSLEGERDMRLLNVLDEHHALPALTVEEKLEFLLWKSARKERFYVMKAQSRLMDMAREDPAPLIARLARGGSEADVLGVALAVTRTEAAIPVLIDRYRRTTDRDTRAATAEALALMAGPELRPRASGRPQDIGRDADALAAWYEERLQQREDAAPPPEEPPEPEAPEGEDR